MLQPLSIRDVVLMSCNLSFPDVCKSSTAVGRWALPTLMRASYKVPDGASHGPFLFQNKVERIGPHWRSTL